MYLKKFMTKEILFRVIVVILLVVVGIYSFTKVSEIATAPETYKTTIQSIDDKKLAVMGVSATAAVASTSLAAVPGDVTTPIANQILDLSSYLFIVVCILVLEKSLLTVLGLLSFKFLVPLSCVLFGISMFVNKRTLKIVAFKLLVFALAIVMIIPLSMEIGDMIYETNKMTVEQVTTNISEENVGQVSEKEPSWIDKLLNKAKQTTVDIGAKAKQMLNGFIDAIAIFIIAYCALPIIVVVFVVWLINFLFGLTIPMPKIILKKDKGEVIKEERLIENE